MAVFHHPVILPLDALDPGPEAHVSALGTSPRGHVVFLNYSRFNSRTAIVIAIVVVWCELPGQLLLHV